MIYKSTISQDELQELPLFKLPSEEICVVDTLEKFNEIKYVLLKEKIWGLDVETRPSFKKNNSDKRKPALLQLTSSYKTYLLRINLIGLPIELINFFNDPNIIKVGLALKDDLKNLYKFSHFNTQSFLDLQTIVKNFGIEELGLKKIAAIVLGYRISKKQQTSNWENSELTNEQIKYAATDSYVTREIYINLIKNDRTSI